MDKFALLLPWRDVVQLAQSPYDAAHQTLAEVVPTCGAGQRVRHRVHLVHVISSVHY